MGKVLAENLLPGDNIVVNIAAMQGGPEGSRVPIGATFNGLGQRTGADNLPVYGARGLTINMNGGAPPAFNLAAYQQALASGQQAQAASIFKAHQAALAQWQEGGNQRLPDRIAAAVLEWAKQEHGVRTDDGPHPVVKLDQISVKPSYRFDNQPTTFVVQVAPIWG